jgi:hypothetical protein
MVTTYPNIAHMCPIPRFTDQGHFPKEKKTVSHSENKASQSPGGRVSHSTPESHVPTPPRVLEPPKVKKKKKKKSCGPSTPWLLDTRRAKTRWGKPVSHF